jgi:hypothetical protein
VTIDDVVNMKWDYFEWFVAALWLKKGFIGHSPPPAAGDGASSSRQLRDARRSEGSGAADECALSNRRVRRAPLGRH